MIIKERKKVKPGMEIVLFGSILIFVFMIWTVLVQTVDVKPVGVNGTEKGTLCGCAGICPPRH